MSDSCRLLFVGDISLGGELAERVARGSATWTDPFVDLQPIFHDVDLAIGNLEEPLFTGSAIKKKRNMLGAPPEAVDALSTLGFTTLSLGNNHITDQGVEGVARTRETLESRGIAPFGAGADLEEARRPVFEHVRGQSFALLAYSEEGRDVGTQVATSSSDGCAPFSLERAEQDISSARKTADHVVVSLHWGYQYDRYPSPEQIAVARKLVDVGAVVVFGHHPHVLQGIEPYKNGLILYSLGNFMFQDFVRTDGLKFRFPRESRSTAAVICEISRDGVESFSTMPIQHGRNHRMRVLRGRQAARKERLMIELSAALGDPNYEALWSRHHRRTVSKRRRTEERLKIRAEVASNWQQARERGFFGSLRSLKARNLGGIVRLCSRFVRIL